MSGSAGVKWVVLAFCLCGLADAQAPEVLRVGAPLDRVIRAKETHSYRVPLEAGQLLHVTARQVGADIVLTVQRPDGAEAARSDLPNGGFGVETIAIRAGAAGDYGVAVAGTGSVEGSRYELRLEAARNAGADDEELLAVHEALFAAERHRREGTAAARALALEEYVRAEQFFDRSGDVGLVADLRTARGLILARTGRPREALPLFEQSLAEYRREGNRDRQASVLNNVGGMRNLLGDLDQSMSAYEEAIAIWEGMRQTALIPIVLNNIAQLYSDQGRWSECIAYRKRALEKSLEIGDLRFAAMTAVNLGAVYLVTRDSRTAQETLQRALELARPFQDVRMGLALYHLGTNALYQEKAAEALPWFEQALAVFRTIGDRRQESRALASQAEARERLGQIGQASDLLAQSLAIAQPTGDPTLIGESLYRQARVLTASGRPADGLRVALEAAGSFRKGSNLYYEIRALEAAGEAAFQGGNPAEALKHTDAAIERAEKLRAGLDEEQNRAFYFVRRQDAFHQRIEILMALGREAEALETSERGRARSMLDMLSETGSAIREGVDPALVKRERDVVAVLNAKGSRLLTRPNDAELRKEIDGLESEYQEVRAAIRRSSPKYAALEQPRPLTVGEMQRDLLREDEVLLEYSLGERRSYLWAIGRDRVQAWPLAPRASIEAAAARVRELLAARTVNPRMETSDDKRRRIAEADRALAAASSELSRMTLGPAAEFLRFSRLGIVPDGALQNVPFAMLPDPATADGAPLIARHEVVLLPSISAVAIIRRESPRPPASKTLAVFADPVFSTADTRFKGRTAAAPPASEETRLLQHSGAQSEVKETTLSIPRLPYTAREAERILTVARGMKTFAATGFEASREAATGGQLSDYRYIHFATHGYLDTERPSLSALVLAQVDRQGKQVDGFLRVADVYNTRLSADLVVLSACQTGLGQEVRGEGLMGLTRAFLYAGAPRVIVSLWNVNDEATAELMAAFYRGLLRDGRTPAAALRAAQMELRARKRWESPYYWAAFVQQGEWR
jgi:CHAT domain-containing protein/Tfp pilus assembly protein PilF